MRSDNEPPFNGNDSHHLQKYSKQTDSHHQPVHSAKDPEVNSLAKGFMRIYRKARHTVIVKGNNL